MNTSLIELRKKPHTSVSAVREFLHCPRKYFLHYEAKEKPAFRPAALVFGSAWHATIGEWLVSTNNSPERLREHLRDGIVERLNDENANVLFDEADQDEGTLVDSALKMLEAFLERVPRPDRTLAVEHPFAVELIHPDTGEVLRTPLVGSIDAIVVEGKTTSVWELKTSGRRWTSEQVEHDLQTTAYGLATKKTGVPNARLELVITTKGGKPNVYRELAVRHQEHEDEFIHTVFSVHRAISAGIDHPIRSWACGSCPYADACRR